MGVGEPELRCTVADIWRPPEDICEGLVLVPVECRELDHSRLGQRIPQTEMADTGHPIRPAAFTPNPVLKRAPPSPVPARQDRSAPAPRKGGSGNAVDDDDIEGRAAGDAAPSTGETVAKHKIQS